MKEFKLKRIVKPYNWIGHLPFAFELIKEKRPEILVELGTHTGNSFCGFCQAISENNLTTKAFAVDTWEGDYQAGKYNELVYNELSEYINAHYSFAKLLRMTFDDALAHFEDGTVDILHIDGLHTYEAVRHDFESWLPKMKKNGVILFHDVCVVKEDFGVYRLWEELKLKYSTLEFEHCFGLGVLFMEKNDKVSLFPQFDVDKMDLYTTGLNLWYHNLNLDLEKNFLNIRNSVDYKVGNFFLKPLRLIKRLTSHK